MIPPDVNEYRGERRYRRALWEIDEFRLTRWRDFALARPELAALARREALGRESGWDPWSARLLLRLSAARAVTVFAPELARRVVEETRRRPRGPAGAGAQGPFPSARRPADPGPPLGELVRRAGAALERGEQHPLLIVAALHFGLLSVDPCPGDAGAAAAILTALLARSLGYDLALVAVLRGDEGLLPAFRRSQADLLLGRFGWEPWLDFWVGCLTAQTARLERELRRLDRLPDRLSPLSRLIISLAQSRGSVRAADVRERSRAAPATVRYHLAALVRAGLLRRLGRSRATSYQLDRAGWD